MTESMRSIPRTTQRIGASQKLLPDGVRIVAWARAIRWAGWGFGEGLIPVFILLFSHTFAEAGLIRSTYEIASLMSLPLIGAWADRVSARRIILLSLLFYPLVGISYFVAGIATMPLFIVLARGFNGILWEMENIGVATYYRRIAVRKNIATSFGYMDVWSNAVWIGAALIGMLLAPFTPIHYLLLAIAPAAIAAYCVAMRAPRDETAKGNDPAPRVPFIGSFGRAINEWRSWGAHLWLLGALVLFSGIIGALLWFFVPIDAYISGANLQFVVLLSVAGAVPSLFGYQFGKIVDSCNNYTLIAGGLVAVAFVTASLAIVPQYTFKLVASFILGVVLELFSVVQNSLITTLGPAETYGQRGSAFEVIVTLGDLTAPLILGIGLDILGFGNVVLIFACAAIVLAAAYHRVETTGGLGAAG